MKNLKRIGTPPEYFDLYVGIVANKNNPRRARLDYLADSVQTRFAEYDAAVASNSLGSITEDATLQACGDDLRHCYEGKTQRLNDLLRSIDDTQGAGALKWCPYCGLTAPGSFDHYLPKEKFPEFSVAPHNLVRSCTKCNSSKGARWLASGNRLFIHFYSDQLPKEQFLYVELHYKDGGFSASFRIEQPADVDPASWIVIENHFRELNLLAEYRDNANNEFVHTTNICAAHLKHGGTDIIGFLEELASEEEKMFGRNHWRNVLLRALAPDSNFANEVASKVQLAN